MSFSFGIKNHGVKPNLKEELKQDQKGCGISSVCSFLLSAFILSLQTTLFPPHVWWKVLPHTHTHTKIFKFTVSPRSGPSCSNLLFSRSDLWERESYRTSVSKDFTLSNGICRKTRLEPSLLGSLLAVTKVQGSVLISDIQIWKQLKLMTIRLKSAWSN